MTWIHLADSLSWTQGHVGRGFLLHDGTIKTWSVDPFRPTDQHEIWQQNHELSPIALNFEIDPDGGVVTDEPTTKVDSIIAADSRLYNAGQRPEFEDDFNLDHFEPKQDKAGKPDYNFIMSSWEGFEEPHRNHWTGKLCTCGWGSARVKHKLRRLSGLQMRRLLKAPDKKYKTPEGQQFLEHLQGLPEDYDSLYPYLAQRWKKGDIRLNTDVPPSWMRMRDEQPGITLPPPEPRLEWHVSRLGNHSWDPVANALPRWHQWFEARQHPTRRGVNVMDPDFTPEMLQDKAAEHQRQLAQARRKQNWLSHYAQYAPAPSHVFGPEAGKYAGWQVIPLDAEQAEGDSEALGHCIGSEDQPYRYNIDAGNIDAYSLRDKEGYPHVSWHFNPGGHDIGHMQGASGYPTPEYRNLISQFHQARGLSDEEGHEDPLENPDAEDAYFTFPPATDVQDYNQFYGDNYMDYAIAHGNIGEGTEFDWEPPGWDSLAADYLNYPGSDHEDFHYNLKHHAHINDFAQAIHRHYNPEDETHREAAQIWNDQVPYEHELPLELGPPEEVDKYNEQANDGYDPEPENWDAMAQDYLRYPDHYGSAPSYRPSEYRAFHTHIQARGHDNAMRDALQNNIDWENEGHQAAVQHWNKDFPTANLHPLPEPPPEQIPGQTGWDWPEFWTEGGQDTTGYNWDRSQYVVPNFSPYYPRAGRVSEPRESSWHFGDYEGWPNWATWNTALMMDNEEPIYTRTRQMIERGASVQALQNYLLRKVVGPYNKERIEEAKEWNETPYEERRDPHFEDLMEKNPQAADLVMGIGDIFTEGEGENPFGPKLGDDEPELIDPEEVDWQYLWDHLYDEMDADNEYEREHQRYQQQGLNFAMPGHSDETNQMLDAWLKHHGVMNKDQRLPGGGSAEHHTRMQVPIEHLRMDEGEYSPDTYAEWQQQGYGSPRARSFGWQTLWDIQKGRANPWQTQTMQQALAGHGYTPEQIQQIMRQQLQLDATGNSWTRVNQPPAPNPDVPGDLTIPQGWTSSYNWEGLSPMPSIKVQTDRPMASPRNDAEAIYQAIGEAMMQGDHERAQWLYQFLPPELQPEELRTQSKIADADHVLAPAVELREWLADLGGEEPSAPSIHHDDESDMILSPSVSQRDGLPYFPPANVPKEYKQAMAERTGNPELDAAIAQFMQSHHEELGDIQDFRHPMVAWGRCAQVAEACAEFLRSKGFKADASSDYLEAFGYKDPQPTESVMTPQGPAGDFTYPEHCAVAIYNEHGIVWWTIDFTAAQYGFTDEFPKVEPGPPGPLIGPQRQTGVTRTADSPINQEYLGRVAGMTRAQRQLMAQQIENYAGSDTSRLVHTFPDGWSIRQPLRWGDMEREGQLMSNCLKLDDPNNDWLEDTEGDVNYDLDEHFPHQVLHSLRDPYNLPHVSFYQHPTGMGELLGQHNTYPKSQYMDYMREYARQHDIPWSAYHDKYWREPDAWEMGHLDGQDVPTQNPAQRSFSVGGSTIKTADSPINQADATNDPLAKNPAIIPSRQGDPDYLDATICPNCQQLHRPDEPCPDSAVSQYKQMERSWYNRDPNALHGAPDGLSDHGMDLGSRMSMAWPNDLYHVSPAANRESIAQNGLTAHEPGAPMFNPTAWGQGIRGNYAFDNLQDAQGYARIQGRQEPMDIWQINNAGQLPVGQDPEGPEIRGAYNDWEPRPEDLNPADFERATRMGMGMDEDPDFAPTWYWHRPKPEDYESLVEATENEGKPWEDQEASMSDSGVSPTAWQIPAHVPAHHLQHVETLTPEQINAMPWQEHWMGDYVEGDTADHLAPEPYHQVRWDSPQQYQDAVKQFVEHHRQGASWDF